MRHKSVPQNTFEIKVENNRGGYTYIRYPIAVAHMGGMGTGVVLSTSNPADNQSRIGETQATGAEDAGREGTGSPDDMEGQEGAD